MKHTPLYALFISAVITIVCLHDCPGEEKALNPTEVAPGFCGSWVNLEYKGMPAIQPQKYVIKNDKTLEMWGLIRAGIASYICNYEILESWEDGEGNTYAMVWQRYTSEGTYHSLWKLNKSKNVLEINFRQGEERPPREIVTNPNADEYRALNLYYLLYLRE